MIHTVSSDGISKEDVKNKHLKIEIRLCVRALF